MVSNEKKLAIIDSNIANVEELIYDAGIKKMTGEKCHEAKKMESAQKRIDSLTANLNALKELREPVAKAFADEKAAAGAENQ